MVQFKNKSGQVLDVLDHADHIDAALSAGWSPVSQETDPEKMKKPELVKYAADNQINIDATASKAEILNAVLEKITESEQE